MEPSIAVTAAICTHNGAGSLPRAVSSLLKQDYPPQLYQVLVVDNVSTDQTKEVVEKLAAEHSPLLTYAFEPKLGLANARNMAAQVATGDVIAFMDDDSLAEPNWISKLAEVYPEQAQVVEQRFLAGLTVAEVVLVLGIPKRTVERRWRMARAWLRRELEGA